jgi:hypothetical protein
LYLLFWAGGKAVSKSDLPSLSLVAARSLAERATNRPEPSPLPLKQSVEYRPEIDGLRAIAVLGVVFFHQFQDI